MSAAKVVVVTGTSTGLGVSIAVQAAKAGHTVYATMRNLGKRNVLDRAAADAGVSLHVLPLDVQDGTTVHDAVARIIEEQGRIDTLVNNAGAGFVRNIEQASEEEIQHVVDLNFMGVVRCTKAVLPHMRRARAGHVINVGSVGGLVGQPFNEIYCAAKFAVEGFTEALATYVTPTFGVRFTVIEPGGITSEFVNNVMKQVAESGGMLQDEYLPVLQRYVGGSRARQTPGVYQSADEVAAVVMQCLESERPPLRMRTSQWSEEFTALKTGLDPDGTRLVEQVTARLLG